MILVGITGKARSGKDTIAKHLWTQHEFTRIALADPMKRAAQQMFGLTDAQTWSDELKEVVIPYWGMSPRQMFQKLGTEAAKGTFGDDVWAKRWRLSYDMLRETDHVVVPDIRFDIEADMIRALGGFIIEVRRGTGLSGSTGAHASELGLSTLPEVFIDNEGTVEELHRAFDKLVGSLK